MPYKSALGGYGVGALAAVHGAKAIYNAYKSYKGTSGGTARRAITVQNNDDRSRLLLSRALRLINRTRDMEVAIMPRGYNRAFDVPIFDKRGRIAKLMEPAKIISFTAHEAVKTADSGEQGVTQYVMWEADKLREYKTALANAGNTIAVDGARDLQSLFNNAGTVQESSNAGTGTALSNNMVVTKIPIWKYKHTLKNTSNFRARICIYEYLAKLDADTSPMTCWQDVYLNANQQMSSGQRTAIDNAVTEITSTTTVDENTINQRPFGRGIHKYWQLVGSVKYDCEPGRAISYTTYAMKRSMSQWDLDNCAGVYMKGWTKFLVFVVHGSLISDSGAAASVSYSSAQFSHMVQHTLMGYGRRNYQPQRCLASDFVAMTAGEDMLDVVDANQRQINPETDGTVTTFVGAAN